MISYEGLFYYNSYEATAESAQVCLEGLRSWADWLPAAASPADCAAVYALEQAPWPMEHRVVGR